MGAQWFPWFRCPLWLQCEGWAGGGGGEGTLGQASAKAGILGGVGAEGSGGQCVPFRRHQDDDSLIVSMFCVRCCSKNFTCMNYVIKIV